MKKNSVIFRIAFLLIWVYACGHPSPESKSSPTNPLYGSWEVEKIEWETKDTTYVIENAQPGIFMINPSRYSIMWTPIDTVRTPFAELSNPTEKEILEGFRSVVFNSGTYALSDSVLTTTAKIAKVPGFEGGKQYYRYQLNPQGSALTLTMYDETYPNGAKPQWFGKYVTRFNLKRATPQ